MERYDKTPRERLEPDWALWSHMRHASLGRAVLLSVNINPDLPVLNVDDEGRESFVNREDFPGLDWAEAQQRLRLLWDLRGDLEYGPGGWVLASVGSVLLSVGRSLPDQFPRALSRGGSGAADDATWWQGSHASRLAREAHARFWRNYDRERPPKAVEILEWLKSQDVSTQMAETIYRVIRPDSHRKGPVPRKK